MTVASPQPPPEPSGGGKWSHPIAVLIANLLGAGGAGYLLLGQKKKGVVAIVLFCAVGFPTCFAASYAISIVFAADGYMQAQHVEAGRRIGEWTFFGQHH
jgi:TM2 domain-containing membrane protein YozV